MKRGPIDFSGGAPVGVWWWRCPVCLGETEMGHEQVPVACCCCGARSDDPKIAAMAERDTRAWELENFWS